MSTHLIIELFRLQYDPSKKSYSNQANVSTDFLAHQPFGRLNFKKW